MMEKVKTHGLLGLLCSLVIFMGCSNSKSDDGSSESGTVSFYKVGHRGTRGLMPENTIPAMKKGLDEGANTIEFDVHITKDHKVIVYHDASANPQYTRLADADITDDNRKDYTFYQMNYVQIESLQVGKNKESYPQQKDTTTNVPLLTTLIDSVESYTNRRDVQPPVYLLEIKSSASTDAKEQPAPEEYVKILMQSLKPWREKLGDRLVIQSFDIRPLKIIHKEYPDIRLGYLTGSKNPDVVADIKELGFTPEFYNPHFGGVTREFLKQAHERDMKVCPWTVDTKEDIAKLKEIGVDGIITDYPNYL